MHRASGEPGADAYRLRRGVFKYEKYGEQFLDSVRDFTRNYRKNEGPDSLGAVDFSSLDYDVVQDYEGEDGI